MMDLTSERRVIPLIFDPLQEIKGRDWRRRVIEDFWIQMKSLCVRIFCISTVEYPIVGLVSLVQMDIPRVHTIGCWWGD